MILIGQRAPANTLINKYLIFILTFFTSVLWIDGFAIAQMPLDSLEIRLERGNKKSLRDLFTLATRTDDPKLEDLTLKYTLFRLQKESEIVENQIPTIEFYYKNERDIVFAPQFNAFILRNKEFKSYQADHLYDQSCDHTWDQPQWITKDEIPEKIEIDQLDLLSTFRNKKNLYRVIEFIASSNNHSKKRTAALELLLGKMKYWPSIKQFLLLRDYKKAGIISESSFRSLVVNSSQFPSENNIKDTYQIVDSIGNATYVRQLGYYYRYNTQPKFFFKEINYLGNLFIKATDLESEKAILADMLTIQDEKILYFLTCKYLLTAKSGSGGEKRYLNYINELTGHHIQNETLSSSEWQNIFHHWLSCYAEFTWDEESQYFINQKHIKDEEKKIVSIYKFLNSNNNDIALDSYKKLLSFNPQALENIDRKYKGKLKNYNSFLPHKKYDYLPNLAKLVQYCEANQIAVDLSEHTTTLLESLYETQNPSKIRSIEETIITSLNSSEITALEIWSIIHSKFPNIAFSTSRILDKFYSSKYAMILEDDAEQKLFLKKASLFSNFNDNGYCKNYLTRLASNEHYDFRKISKQELDIQDIDIVASFEKLKLIDQSSNNSSVAYFIQHPFEIELSDIVHLENASSAQCSQLANYLKRSRFLSLGDPVIMYFNTHPTKNVLSALKGLSKVFDEKPIIRQNFLQVYNTCKKCNKSKETSALAKREYEKIIKQIQQSEDLSLELIEPLINSDQQKHLYRKILLQNIKKIKRSADLLVVVRKLNLTVDELSAYVDSNLVTKNAVKIYQTIRDDFDNIFKYAFSQLLTIDANQQASYCNSIVSSNWFLNNVSAFQDFESELNIMKKLLIASLNTSEYLSEYEEERTVQNVIFLELANYPIDTKLDIIIESQLDFAVKQKVIQTLFSRASYNQLAIILQRYENLNTIGLGQSVENIFRDFGIPIFEIENGDQIKSLSKDIHVLNIKKLNLKYLSKAGLVLTLDNGKLDFDKISGVLRFDISRPIIGSGGRVRDHFVYPVIKILEQHFQTSLGFHKKLNENQNIYKYNALERSIKWQEYLLKNGHLKHGKPIYLTDH